MFQELKKIAQNNRSQICLPKQAHKALLQTWRERERERDIGVRRFIIIIMIAKSLMR